MRDFIVGDYVIYTLVEIHFVLKGIVLETDDKCLFIKSDDNGLYKDYKTMCLSKSNYNCTGKLYHEKTMKYNGGSYEKNTNGA